MIDAAGHEFHASPGIPFREMHYAYDGAGRLLVTAFAQTPASGFTPSTGASYYDSSHLASSRARAYYVYDAGGRLTQLNHWWDVWGTADYNTPDALLSNTCSYEVTTATGNPNRGLKTVSDFYTQNPSDHTAFSLDHEEQYGYDPARDYLTSASYDGGSTSTTWSYDAAGNRNDASVVDNLNRATTISGVSRTYDILGNTTAIGSSKSMSWDALNRMTSLTASSTTWDYTYRADGMRVKKSKSAGLITTAYRYDGQMPIEEYNDGAGWPRTFLQVIRYGPGARGIDFIQRVTNTSVVTTGYPLYDTHGNMIATLAKSGGSYSINDQRLYDVWGGVRSGSSTGEPNPRHCANLGHLQDDESGFVYMRARYYESASGRFTSEDFDRQGVNWFCYCANDPVNRIDADGGSYFDLHIGIGITFLFAALIILTPPFGGPIGPKLKVVAVGLLLLACLHLGNALGQVNENAERDVEFFDYAIAYLDLFAGIAALIWGGTKVANISVARGLHNLAIIVTAAYALTLLGLIIQGDAGE